MSGNHALDFTVHHQKSQVYVLDGEADVKKQVSPQIQRKQYLPRFREGREHRAASFKWGAQGNLTEKATFKLSLKENHVKNYFADKYFCKEKKNSITFMESMSCLREIENDKSTS